MKYSLTSFLLLLSLNIFSQKNNTLYSKGILFNPFALLESNATLDFGYITELKTKTKILFNIGVLLPFNINNGDVPFNKGGFRILTQYREYKKNDYFLGFELKYRHVAFNNFGKYFKNTLSNDTFFLANPNTRANIFAGAFIFGVQEYISKNKKWAMEATIGLGIRFKYVHFKEASATIIPIQYFDRRAWVPAKNEEIQTIHMPGTFRLIYFL